MKILFLLTYYYPHWTGLTAYAQRIAEGLARKGHQVTVLTSKHKTNLKKEEFYKKVRIIRLQPLIKISRSLITPQFITYLLKLRKEYQIVSIHLPYSDVLPATLICRLLKKRVFLTHNGDLVLPRCIINRLLEKIYYSTTYLAGKLSQGVIAQTKDYSQSSKLLSSLNEKLSFIYPPVSAPKPNNLAVAKWRQKLGLVGKPVIGFAGRFVEEKGFDFLLKAIPLVNKIYPKATFVFAGKTNIDYENFYQTCLPLIRNAKKNLIFLGLIKSRKKLANFYSMLDVFVISSRSDCFPSTQIEAILCGTPVVCTNIPGAREVVRKTNMGIIVAKNNPKTLAKGIISVIKQGKREYNSALKRAQKMFDYQKSVDLYEKIFIDSITT